MNTSMNSESNIRTSFINYLPAGVIGTTACVGVRAFLKSNRGDTFTKTIKNCAKAYTVENKKDITTFFSSFLNMKKIGEKINNIGNKKMFAFLFAADTIVTAFTIGVIRRIFTKKNKR